jgi:hypothetical protein
MPVVGFRVLAILPGVESEPTPQRPCSHSPLVLGWRHRRSSSQGRQTEGGPFVGRRLVEPPIGQATLGSIRCSSRPRSSRYARCQGGKPAVLVRSSADPKANRRPDDPEGEQSPGAPRCPWRLLARSTTPGESPAQMLGQPRPVVLLPQFLIDITVWSALRGRSPGIDPVRSDTSRRSNRPLRLDIDSEIARRPSI